MRLLAGIRRPFARFCLFLCALIGLFFYPVLFRGQGYLYGDYRQQFYPWAKTLAGSLKAFSLPLWTPHIGCGFPLLAEGQIAALHPLNALLYFFLPFPLSYQASFIVLFFLAGIFTYLFARSLGTGREGSALSAVVYLFGSSYAGLFYGIMMLRTTAWLPLVLWLTVRLCRTGLWRDTALLALGWVLIFLGGYPQMAVYAVLTVVLFLFFVLLRSAAPKKSLGLFFAALALGAGGAAVQLWPTWELMQFSGRASSTLDFALEKSLTPLNLASLFWPGLGGVLRSDFYIGVLPLCLALYALPYGRTRKMVRPVFFLVIFFVLLSFGRYNPLYVVFLGVLKLYFFRIPAKFLFFSVFWMGILAGIGLDILVSGHGSEHKSFVRTVRAVGGVSLVVLILGYAFTRLLKGPIFSMVENFIRKNIYQKTGHSHPLSDYLQRIPSFYEQLLRSTDPAQFPMVTVLLVWALLVAGFWLFRKRIFLKKNLVLFIFAATVLDLFCFSFYATGFRGNRLSFDTVRADDTVRYLTSRDGMFRSYELVLEGAAPRWLPNSNMLFGYSSAGLYSPLAPEAYRDYLKEFGAVDNAQGPYPVRKENISRNLQKLAFINVRYLVSGRPLDGIPGLELVFSSQGGDLVYENKKWQPRAFFVKDYFLQEGKKQARVPEETGPAEGRVTWQSYTGSSAQLSVYAANKAFLFMSESYDKGWRVFVDGSSAELYRVNSLFRGVKVPGGEHRIRMEYRPFSFRAGLVVSLACWAAVIGILVFSFFKRRARP